MEIITEEEKSNVDLRSSFQAADKSSLTGSMLKEAFDIGEEDLDELMGSMTMSERPNKKAKS